MRETIRKATNRRHKSTREMAAEAAAMPPLVRRAAKPIEIDARYYARKARLEEVRTELNGQLKLLRGSIKLSERDEHKSDDEEVAVNAVEIHTAAGLLKSVNEQLYDVHAALQALEDGTYGQCVVCGEEIPEKRLDALPFAKNCISCAQLANPEVVTPIQFDEL